LPPPLFYRRIYSERQAWEPYNDFIWRLLRIDGAFPLCLTGFIARMPIAMYSLGTVLMIVALHGNYALADGLSATGLAGGAVLLTKVAAWADRYGARRVLLPQALIFALATVAFGAAAEARAPVWLLFVTGTVAASALPALARSSGPPGRRCAAMSWVGFSNCLGGGAGSAVSGWAVDYGGASGGYLVATGCAVLAAVACLMALPALGNGKGNAIIACEYLGVWHD
jgi:MFS family permease